MYSLFISSHLELHLLLHENYVALHAAQWGAVQWVLPNKSLDTPYTESCSPLIPPLAAYSHSSSVGSLSPLCLQYAAASL